MRGINTEKYLSLYRELKISKSELQQAIGEGLHNVEFKKHIASNAVMLLTPFSFCKTVQFPKMLW